MSKDRRAWSRPPGWRRMAGLGLAIVVIGAGVWAARRGAHSREIGRTAAPSIRAAILPRVKVVQPQIGGIERTIQQPATIHAFETVDLYAMVSGYLKSQTVDIGSRIRKGEVLAEIDVPRDAKALEEAVSVVEQSRAMLVQAESQVKVAEAQRDAAAAAARQADSEVGRLQAARVLAEKQLARVSRLAAERAADQRLVDEQRSVLDAAVAAERTATIAVQTAAARAAAVAAEVQKARADAAEARAMLAVAEARRDRAAVNLRYARIVAPFDGVVTFRAYHPGALIRSASEGGDRPLLTVKRIDRMRVVVLVPDRDVVRTRVGETAVVRVDALDDRAFTGTLARIAQSEDSERMMRVEIDLPNPDAVLYDGMYGKATIELGRDPHRLALPAACIFERSGRSGGVVYVARDGVARRADVRIGGENGSMVEVLSGIKSDDAVIVRSGTSIDDGMRISTGG